MLIYEKKFMSLMIYLAELILNYEKKIMSFMIYLAVNTSAVKNASVPHCNFVCMKLTPLGIMRASIIFF